MAAREGRSPTANSAESQFAGMVDMSAAPAMRRDARKGAPRRNRGAGSYSLSLQNGFGANAARREDALPPVTEGPLVPEDVKKAEEAELDERLERLVGRRRSGYPKHEWAALRELHRLEVLYPGEYVVYQNVWEGEDESVRLKRRDVLHHSSSRESAQGFLSELDEELQKVTSLVYVEPTRGKPRAR